MPIKARNNFVFIIRDQPDAEKLGLIIPKSGRPKLNTGIIHSVGKLSRDPDIKNGKGQRAMFHETVGFTVPFEGQDYLVLLDSEIIAVV